MKTSSFTTAKMFILSLALMAIGASLAFAWPSFSPIAQEMLTGIGEMLLGVLILAGICLIIVEKQMHDAAIARMQHLSKATRATKTSETLSGVSGCNTIAQKAQVEELEAA